VQLERRGGHQDALLLAVRVRELQEMQARERLETRRAILLASAMPGGNPSVGMQMSEEYDRYVSALWELQWTPEYALKNLQEKIRRAERLRRDAAVIARVEAMG